MKNSRLDIGNSQSLKVLVVTVALFLSAGCAKSGGVATTANERGTLDHGSSSHASHDHEPHADVVHAHEDQGHDSNGPHGGRVFELEYEGCHVELTLDEALHRVGIRVLADDAKTDHPIAATNVRINVAVNGQPQQYELNAVAQATEPNGSASYFEIVNEPLCDMLCGENNAANTRAMLNVKIEGKPYLVTLVIAPHEHNDLGKHP